MVGVGAGGRVSVAARVCMVDASGSILLDTFVRPLEPVTDLRTAVSGVREEHLSQAPALAQVRPVVASLLQNRLLVGHALRNDLEALGLSHPRKRTRDTTAYPPFLDGAKGRARPLKALAQEELGLEIQTGEHSPVEDARAALYLYLKHRRSWEAWVRGKALPGGVVAPQKLLSWEELAKKDAMADL
ncbi:hypothetical protein H632_c181p0 [Helicosporidium sp. ATCC 50920]|nr:hypothetical protein H632_c181p0 [Helicosporidium sp. ATCC 50920]|eukprot:KDD76560.1 hypothetical protein H632_c181p0 [Helicosporidium sp. ATCC 50920]